jgi:multidrug efflux system membrane fusion protein
MKKKVILPLLAVAALGFATWWIAIRPGAAPSADAASGAPRAALVTVVRAEQRDVPVTVQVNGSVVSLNSVDLRPQVTNTVREVHVKEGQFVKEGQLLFTLDDRADQANLAKARAQQLKDEATLADLERQFRRGRELLAQNFISKSAIEGTQAQLEAQRATVAADRAAVQAAQVALSYSTLRAPIAGRIGAVSIYPGSLVQPTTTLLSITQLDPIAVSFPVPEARLQDLLEAARRRAPVEAIVPGRAPVQGVLDFVDNAVDPQIGTVRAKAVFQNDAQQLWPGQFVQTQVTVRTIGGATVVPAAALMQLAEGMTVYVVDDTGTARRRKVEPLQTLGTQMAVRGVQPGEQVVLEGKQNVRDGGKVRIETSAASPAPASTVPETEATPRGPKAASAVSPATSSAPDNAPAPARSRT